MSMTPSADRPLVQRWKEFWFRPGDPTTLGFIRIAAGILVLYTHLAYSLDLQAFFGKFGWYGAQFMERERKEYPRTVNSFWDWDESGDVHARAPEFPQRRAAVIDFIRSLPSDRGERTRDIAYLKRVSEEDSYNTAIAALQLVLRLYGTKDADREKMLKGGLEQGKQYYAFDRGAGLEYDVDQPPATVKSEPIFPEISLSAPVEVRTAIAQEIRDLIAVMPKNSTDAQYVVAHLVELDQVGRRAFVNFCLTLPDDAAERNRIIDYLDYWNNDPRRLARQGHFIFSVWFHVTNPTQMAIIHGGILFVIALFTIGFCTRVTSVFTWIAVVGYIHRTNQVLFGMDTMMNILLIYLMIGNSGAALSVDRLIARYRAARASLRRNGTIDERTRSFLAQAPPSEGANFGIRLIQVHFCFIYMASGLAKLLGPAWWSGNAFWDVMINPEFTLMKYHWFENAVRWMVGNSVFGKPFYFAATMFGVWFTWGLEISFPFLVWTRLRPVVLWLAVLLHAGIGVLMGLNLFELLMMTMMLAYFPAGVIRDRLRGGPDLPKLSFGYDPGDERQARAAALVTAADVDAQVRLEPGKRYQQPIAATLFSQLRLLSLFRVLLFVPGLSTVLGRLFTPAAAPARRTPAAGPPTPTAAS
jgi:hypothetical protein